MVVLFLKTLRRITKRRGISLTRTIYTFGLHSTSLHRLIAIVCVGVKHACVVLVYLLPLEQGELDCLGIGLLPSEFIALHRASDAPSWTKSEWSVVIELLGRHHQPGGSSTAPYSAPVTRIKSRTLFAFVCTMPCTMSIRLAN